MSKKNKEVGIATLGFNPWLKMHAICNALDQTYNPKVLHLLHQPPFPPELIHDSFIKIVEHRVKGNWPAIWFFKMKLFIRRCKSPYFAIMDEDDRFEPRYLEHALAPIINGAPFAWNLNNIIVKNLVTGKHRYPMFKFKKYRSGIGTLVGQTKELAVAFDKLTKECPRGLTRNGGGPVDALLKRIITRMGVVNHKGCRRYFYHMNTNTKGDRDKRENVDFGWNERILPGKFKGKKRKR